MYKDDKRLAKDVLHGNRNALRVFFDRYYAPTYRYCLRRVSPNDAEEVATDTLRHAIRRIETYRGEATLITWIHRVARSQLSAHFERTGKHRNLVLIDDNENVRAEVEAMAADLTQTPEKTREQAERQQLVHLMLDYLPAEYGKILEWKYIEGLTVEEIAQKLTTSTTAIQSKLARARRAFKKHFANLETKLAQRVVGFKRPTRESV